MKQYLSSLKFIATGVDDIPPTLLKLTSCDHFFHPYHKLNISTGYIPKQI